MRLTRLWLMIWTAMALAPLTAQGATIHVKADAAGTSTGSTWADAYPSLQSALAAAQSGDEIWVAAGTYKPTTGTDRTISFVLKDGVNVYGGFAATETSRDQRDWTKHETILSGDIGTSVTMDNSYHVVVGANCDIDGFTIALGYANQGSNNNYQGAGAICSHLAVAGFKNCKFVNNQAMLYGGACLGLSSTLTDCIFAGNDAASGGALWGGHAIRCKFINNRATGDFGGGAMAGGSATGSIFVNNQSRQYGGAISEGVARDCVFTSNTALSFGGAIWNTSATNCVFHGNSATLGGAICVMTFEYEGEVGKAINAPIANCTIFDNTASCGGGIFHRNEASSSIVNCVLWDNNATTGSQIGKENAYYLGLSHCDIQNSHGSGTGWDTNIGSDAGGNIDANPCFMDSSNPAGPDGVWRTGDDGLQLETGSPCINASSFGDAPQADVVGNLRDHLPDIGAYENQSPGPIAIVGVYDGSTTISPGSTVNLGAARPDSEGLEKTLYVRNIGTCDLFTSSATVGAPFNIVQQPSAQLSVGTSTPLVLSLLATTTGTYTRTLSFITNDLVHSTFTMNVTGTIGLPGLKVLNGGVVVTNHDAVHLRTGNLGEAAQNATLTIRNVGETPLTVNNVRIDLPFRIAAAPGADIAPGDIATINISLDTKTVGSFSDTLSFETNDTSNETFLLTINGVIQAKPKVLFVRADSTATSMTANFGGSWATAYPDLQMAIHDAQPGNEIWVSKGTYKPMTGTDRSISFVMPEDVGMYGGFAGTETAIEQRNLKANITILSGDINSAQTYDNSYTVLYGGNLAVLDGFTITGSSFFEQAGCGMRNHAVSPVIRNCRFIGNHGGSDGTPCHGAGMANISAAPRVINCVFIGNSLYCTEGAVLQGGAMYNDSSSSPEITNCVFAANIIDGGSTMVTPGNTYGGAIYAEGSAKIVNCVFYGNQAIRGKRLNHYTYEYEYGVGLGDALYLKGGPFTVMNCIFWNSVYRESGIAVFEHCDIQGCGGSGSSWTSAIGTDGGGNIDRDPLFLNAANPAGADGIWLTADDGLRLVPGSPCIDAGAAIGAAGTDITGAIRCNLPDMGAYEGQSRNAARGWVLYR